MKEQRLQPELERGEERRDVDREITGEPAGEDPPRREERCARRRQPVDRRSDERAGDREVEAVRPQREDAAVAEQQRLDGERHRDGDRRPPRAEHDRRHRDADRMSRRPAGERQVEHHDDEREGREERDQRHEAGGEERPDTAQSYRPERHRRGIERRAGRGTEIAVRNVHGAGEETSIRTPPRRGSRRRKAGLLRASRRSRRPRRGWRSCPSARLRGTGRWRRRGRRRRRPRSRRCGGP